MNINNLPSQTPRQNTPHLKKPTHLRTKRIRHNKKQTSPKNISSSYNPSPSSSSYEPKQHLLHSRQENSLGELTKNFIEYIKESGKETININELVKRLKVKKRRIYDITNVLEGIGYIKKHAKNEISWIHQSTLTNDLDVPFNPINKDNKHKCNNNINQITLLENESKSLEEQIKKIKNEFNFISEQKDFNDYGYITEQDLLLFNDNKKIDLLAITAPKGTSVDIINPNESKQAYYKVKKEMDAGKIERDDKFLQTLQKESHLSLESYNGEIEVYRVIDEEIIPFITKTEDDNNDNNSNNKQKNLFFGNEIDNGFMNRPNNDLHNSNISN
jgi:transcription factor E2F3